MISANYNYPSQVSRTNKLATNGTIDINRCKYYNKLNNKLEQGRIESIVVIFTSIKLNKSIAFFHQSMLR